MSEDRVIDWVGIEREYRAGIRTLRDIADQYGVSHTAIKKRADKYEWTRDLKAKIQAKAEELVSKAEVSKVVSTESLETEKQIIAVNAQIQADKIMEHRSDIQQKKSLCKKLFDEIEAITDNKELFEQLGEELRNPDRRGNDRLNDIYRKIIALPERADVFKKLTDSFKVYIALEREAFGIKSAEDDRSNPDDDILRSVLGK